MLADRHGEKAVIIGDFAGFEPDAVKEPEQRLRIEGRIAGHLYVSYEKVAAERRDAAEKRIGTAVRLMEAWGKDAYMHREAVAFIDELEIDMEKGGRRNKYSAKEDVLSARAGAWSGSRYSMPRASR